MNYWGNTLFAALALFASLMMTGCDSAGINSLDDEKEQHFLLGKSRVNSMDYTGAVEAFSESLVVNPRSGAAHFQLACLFDTKVADPSAAIYHYQEYLRLNPKADNSEVVKQRIYSCKQQLAADVLPLPSTPAAQRQLEDLAEKNRQLQTELEKWRAYYSTQQNSQKTNGSTTSSFSSSTSDGSVTFTGENLNTIPTGSSAPTSNLSTTRTQNQTNRNTKQRTHTVAAGDTLASIARKHGISLTALQAANPGITPKKLKIGQILNLPSQ